MVDLKKNQNKKHSKLYNTFLSNFFIVSSKNSFVINILDSKVHTNIHIGNQLSILILFSVKCEIYISANFVVSGQ